MNILKVILLASSVSLLAACEKSPESDSTSPAKKSLSGSKVVLATIDGVEIVKSQLDALLVNMFGEYKASQVDAASRKNALDSLLAAHALSKRALQNLPEERINEVEEKTRRYHENLLISTYMQTEMDASPFSSEEIKNHYKNNLEKFGKRTVKEYQFLTTRTELAEESRDKYLAIVSGNNKAGKLQLIKQALENQKFDVQLYTGVLDKKILNARLYNFINAQALNKISEITFIDNKPHISTITSENTVDAKPLAEVRDSIRKTLVLKKLKEAIKKQSAEALADSEIVYSK